MPNKAMWDFMDKAEGRKDSSFSNMNKERERQGYKKVGEKKHEVAKKMKWEKAKNVTKGIHQMGLRDEPRHKTLSGKEVKY